MGEKNVKLGQYFLAFVKWYDHEGKEVQPLSLPTWNSSQANVISCVASVGNPGAAECRALKTGAAEIVATANFGPEFGSQSASIAQPFVVSDQVVPTGEVIISYGEVRPVSRH